MKFAFRTDAAAGTGRLKRCLALAHALRDRGALVTFFSRSGDAAAAAAVQAEGFAAVELGASSAQGEVADATAFVHAARILRPEVVVVDHESLGGRWERAVRGALAARLSAIDTPPERTHDVDILIAPDLLPDPAHPPAGRSNAETALLGGPRYALLGPAYALAPRHVPQAAVYSIGICMGDADTLNLSETAYDACRVLAAFEGEIEIATAAGNPHLERLRWRTAADAGTLLSLDPPDLEAFFARHDVLIGSGGETTWERCCVGAPTLAVIAAPNQRATLLPLQQQGALELLSDEPPTADPIARALKQLLADAARRAALCHTAHALVDGLGAARVADRLFLLLP